MCVQHQQNFQIWTNSTRWHSNPNSNPTLTLTFTGRQHRSTKSRAHSTDSSGRGSRERESGYISKVDDTRGKTKGTVGRSRQTCCGVCGASRGKRTYKDLQWDRTSPDSWKGIHTNPHLILTLTLTLTLSQALDQDIQRVKSKSASPMKVLTLTLHLILNLN